VMGVRHLRISVLSLFMFSPPFPYNLGNCPVPFQ